MPEIRIEKKLPPEAPSRKTALKLFIIAALGLFAMSFAGGLLPRGMGEDSRMLVLNLFYYLLFLGLPCWFCLRRRPGTSPALRPNPISLPVSFFIVVLAVLCVFFVNDILLLWSIPFQKLGFNVNAGSMELPTTRGGLLVCVLYAAVLPGIFEELTFRGMILPAFEQQGSRRAVRVSALLFALLHGSLIGLPAQLLLGMLIAELVICCDSIYAGLIFHTAYNASTLILQYAQTATDPSMAAPVADYFAEIGGWGGVVSLLIGILFTAALLRFAMKTFSLRAKLTGVLVYPKKPCLPFSKGEKGLLAVCVLLVVLLYGVDVIAMLTI